MGYRLAFAGTGEYVDQHFGAARCFQVYDIEGGAYKYVETRETEAGRQGGFERVFETLKDCDMVFACQVGPSAAAFMAAKGKRVFEAAGAVEEIIAQIVEKKLLD